MLPLPGIDPVSKSLLPSHLCPDLSFNISIVFGSFWLAFLFLQVSSLVTKIKDLRGHQGFLFWRCLPRSSAAVSVTSLLKCVTMESRSVSSSTSVARSANLQPIVALKALIIVGSFSFSKSNLVLGRIGFFEFLRRVWKVIITMSCHSRFQHLHLGM